MATIVIGNTLLLVNTELDILVLWYNCVTKGLQNLGENTEDSLVLFPHVRNEKLGAMGFSKVLSYIFP